MTLTKENYSKGFLIDEELMGGVTRNPNCSDEFVAFILRHSTGEYLGYQPFLNLQDALDTLNQVKRSWSFEVLGGCGGCSNGKCKAGKCGQGQCGKEKCSV